MSMTIVTSDLLGILENGELSSLFATLIVVLAVARIFPKYTDKQTSSMFASVRSLRSQFTRVNGGQAKGTKVPCWK